MPRTIVMDYEEQRIYCYIVANVPNAHNTDDGCVVFFFTGNFVSYKVKESNGGILQI